MSVMLRRSKTSDTDQQLVTPIETSLNPTPNNIILSSNLKLVRNGVTTLLISQLVFILLIQDVPSLHNLMVLNALQITKNIVNH